MNKEKLLKESIIREDAIKMIKDIQNSRWGRNGADIPKGNIAKMVWDNNDFSYGMEYGAISALMQLFRLTKEDL